MDRRYRGNYEISDGRKLGFFIMDRRYRGDYEISIGCEFSQLGFFIKTKLYNLRLKE